ncbi:unnamed protein product [Effrenium voratum]|uniref:Uncharacterized protein n=1 Tax=Effrenium voratum TaxID=2562239 RepID=A0AA36NET0_9DINO|nr:unnamed protein product [Effrenium voratum]CAJ1461019.1 unnamed protein product [Effrenium voratum]
MCSCIEEGCSVEEIVQIQEKLEHDEGRLKDEIRKLQAEREGHEEVSYEGIGLLRLSLSRIHSLNNKLRAMLDVHSQNFKKEFGAYLAFGNSETGGFLNLVEPQAA